VNPLRSLLAILSGLAFISIVVELLEFTLVNAVAGQPLTDPEAYFAVRNQPRILAGKLVYNSLAALLGGYAVAKVAGHAEIAHGGFAAAVQTASLAWGALASDFSRFTPGWMWAALIVLTAPAMMAGAAIRARARRGRGTASEVEP
jgi:hypothetical protein